MEKFVLGIIAIVVLHVAFGIYITNEAVVEHTVRSHRLRPAALPAVRPAELPDPLDDEEIASTNPADPTDEYAGDAPNTRSRTIAATSGSYQMQVVNAARRAVRRDRSPIARGAAQLEYFGGMVVERSFAFTARTRNRPSDIDRKQVFGKMMVERTFAYPAVQKDRKVKGRNSVYVARTLHELRGRTATWKS